MKKLVFTALLASAVLATPAMADDRKLPFPAMAIKGEGTYAVKPDYATFSLTIQTRDKSSDKATRDHAGKVEKMAAILAKLKEEGLRLGGSNFTVRTEQQRERADGYLTGRPVGPIEYILTTRYTFATREITSQALNKMIDNVATGDLYELGSLRFYPDDSHKASLEARKAAVANAREQAEAYAEAADMKLVEIMEIADGEASFYRREEDGVADMPSRRIGSQWVKVAHITPPKTIDYSASVNMVWRISSRDK